MKKILFAITGLTLGGAERVLVDITNKLCDYYDITILTIYNKGELEKELDKKIKLISICDASYLELSKKDQFLMSLKFNSKLFLKTIYKKYIKNRYDYEVAFLEGPMTHLLSVSENDKKIAFMHTDLSNFYGNGLKAKIKKHQDQKLYRKFSKLAFVSKDNIKNFEKHYDVDVEKKVITNYIDIDKIIRKGSEKVRKLLIRENDAINFLSVARLNSQKAIDRIIRVHKKLIDKGLAHKFYIIGDGPERDNLEKLIENFNVQDTFILLGSMTNPYPHIKDCDVFTLLSNCEGYGMVLIEAQIFNKPIIITKTAAVEAIAGYDNSVIVENNEDAIYNGLKDIIVGKTKFNNKQGNQYKNDYIIDEIKKLFGDEDEV